MYRKIFNSIIIIIMIVNIIIIALVGFLVYPNNNDNKKNEILNKFENTMSLSKNKRNVVYFMVDMTTGFDVTSILQSNRKFNENFSGFTNYQNLISSNFGTNASIPNIFGGYDYNPYYKNHGDISDVSFKKYMKNAMSVLINAFGKSNWDIGCVGNQYYDYNPQKAYWSSNTNTIEADFNEFNVQAVTAPDISNVLSNRYQESLAKLNLNNDIYKFDSNQNDISVNEYLSHLKIKDTQKSKFLTIMNESNHIPFVMNKFGNFQAGIERSTETLYESTQGFINKINNFITYLKTNKIYDNTMIVINSDHGNAHGSMTLNDPKKYNKSGIDYNSLKILSDKYGAEHFLRHFPTLLVKPFNNKEKIKFDNNHLYTNTDALTFIKEYNKDTVSFDDLDKTKDVRYLKNLNDIDKRLNTWMPSYGADTLWDDSFTHYQKPTTGWFSDYTYLVKNSIYDTNNYLRSKDRNDYYSPENLANWVKAI